MFEYFDCRILLVHLVFLCKWSSCYVKMETAHCDRWLQIRLSKISEGRDSIVEVIVEQIAGCQFCEHT